MTQLLLNPKTYARLEAIKKQPPHGLLLSGETGVGLGTIARQLAEDLSDNPHTVRMVMPDEKGTITIETVRGLYVATRSKQVVRSVIVIDDAEKMSQPAQNAVLKLLEEPTQGTMFILTSHQPLKLLPTVRSRVQEVEVVTVSTQMSAELLNQQGLQGATLARQLLFLASGRPALLLRLVEDEKLRARYLSVAKSAKDFIGGNPYQRIAISAKLGHDREAALLMLRVTTDMLSMQLRRQPDATVVELTERVLTAYERIAANGNVKAQLLSLSV